MVMRRLPFDTGDDIELLDLEEPQGAAASVSAASSAAASVASSAATVTALYDSEETTSRGSLRLPSERFEEHDLITVSDDEY